MQRHFSMQVSGGYFFVLGPTLTDEDGKPTWAIRDSELKTVLLEAWPSIYDEDDSDKTATPSKGRAGPGSTHFCWPLALALRVGPIFAGPDPGPGPTLTIQMFLK